MAKRRIPARLDPYYSRLMGLRERIWDLRPDESRNTFHAGLIYSIRFFYVFLKEIQAHQLWQRAASLTYTTILSLFPLLIILTSIGSVFYSEAEEEKIIEFIEARLLPPTDADILNIADRQEFADRQDQIQGLVQNIRQMSESYRESAPGVGVFGLVAFLAAAFLLYNSIEQAFESSWETGRRRTVARTISGFTILIVFAPLIFGVSITASSFLVKILGEEEVQAEAAEVIAAQTAQENARIAQEKEFIELETDASTTVAPDPTPFATTGVEVVTSPTVTRDNDDIITAVRNLDVVKVLLSLITPVFNSIMLTLAFMLVPQRRVRLGYALIGGFTAGILWELAKVGFFYYVYLSTMRRQLLQSLGAVPIFLIWIYFTWLVFLLGNELTFVSQNFRKLLHLYFGRRLSTLFDGQIFVATSLLVANAFDRAEGGFRMSELAQKLQLTFREFETVVQTLTGAGVLEITVDNRVTLARPASKIPVQSLLELGCDPRELCEYYELSKRPEVEQGLKVLNERVLAAGKELTLADLLEDGAKNG